jgi:hypothetical protein
MSDQPEAWVGVDPGAVRTGVVLRRGPDLLWHATVTAPQVTTLWSAGKGKGMGVGEDYARAIRRAVQSAWEEWIDHGRADSDVGDDLPGLAIEQVNAPTGRVGGAIQFLAPGYMMATTYALSAAQSVWLCRPDHWHSHVMVPSTRNGHGTLGGYPAALVTPGERRHGLDRKAPDGTDVSHQRSAWDVAGLAGHVLTVRDASDHLGPAVPKRAGAGLW